MGSIFEIFEGIAVIGTMFISAITLFTTKALQKTQQQTSIMATKRSERIEKMRENSAGIISCVRCIIYDLDDKQTTLDLLSHAHNFILLLQYQDEYKQDVDLIKKIHAIINLCLAKEIDKNELEMELTDFWWKCNVYIGADFERLKRESVGNITKSGRISKEANSFEQIYSMLQKDYETLHIGKKKVKEKV